MPEAGRRLHRTHSSPRVAIVPPRRIRPSPSPPRRTLSIPLLLARSLPSSVARTPSPCRHRARGHKPPRRSGGSRGAPPSSSAPYASARSSRSASRRRHRPSSPTTAVVVHLIDLPRRTTPSSLPSSLGPCEPPPPIFPLYFRTPPAAPRARSTPSLVAGLAQSRTGHARPPWHARASPALLLSGAAPCSPLPCRPALPPLATAPTGHGWPWPRAQPRGPSIQAPAGRR